MKPSVIEAKKAQAMQAHAEGLAEVNRKLDEVNQKLDFIIEVTGIGERGKTVVVDQKIDYVNSVVLTAMSEPEPVEAVTSEPEPEPEPEPEVDSVVEKPKSNKKK